VFIKHCLA